MNTIQTTEQLHQCIILATAGSSNSTTASSMLDAMCATSKDGGSRLCTALLRQIFEHRHHHPPQEQQMQQQQTNVIFYSLTTIQRALAKNVSGQVTVDEPIRMDLRQIIFHYILCTDNGIGLTNDNKERNMNMTMLPKYLRTKVGVVLSLLVQADFPDKWSNAFHELIQTMNFGELDINANDSDNNNDNKTRKRVLEVQRKDIFLRMLDAFCDEVVEKTQHERNTLIKDIIRGFAVANVSNLISPESSISAAIIETIFRIFTWSYPLMSMPILTTSGSASSTEKEGIPELQKLPVKAMAVLKRFIPWLDLSLILNENIMSILFSCVSSAGPGDADDDDGSLSSQLAVQALDCLKEIVCKGMENPKKIVLIMSIQLLEKLSGCGLNLVEIDGTHITVVIKVAELVNLIGLELFTFWDNQCLSAVDLSSSNMNEVGSVATELNKLVNLFFYTFAYDDIDVSGAVIPLAIRMVAIMEKEIRNKAEDLPFRTTNHISQLMAVMYKQMQYPADFEYDYEDEDDAEEEMYRGELRKLNQAITRICPDENLQFICSALSNIELPLSSAPTPLIEAALRLVYHYCEGIRPVPGIQIVMKNDTFREILISLHSSDIMAHPHREVLLLYYDISVRYAKILKQRTDLLPNLLNSLSGPRGLQHEHRRVRSRSCYFLLKLVKALGTLIRPFVEPAIGGILELLSNESTLTLHPDDTLYLFETIGLLLGKTGLDEADQRNYLTAVITPHVQRIEGVLNDPNLLRDAECFGGVLAYKLAGLAFLSKGFTKKICSDVQLVLLKTVPISLKVLRSLPNSTPIRDKCMIYLQRMILCLGEKLLPSIYNFLELLIEHCTNDDVLDVAHLLNQICFKYKKKSIPYIDGAALPFLKKCQNLLPNMALIVDDKGTVPPHLVTERNSILKIIYAFLHQIVLTQCTEVLLSSSNVSSLEDILRTMGEGALSASDPAMKKTCVLFIKELVNQWLSQDCTSEAVMRIQSGFKQYVLKNFLPGIFDCFISKDFNEKDAMHYRVVREVAVLLVDVKARCSPEEFDELILSRNGPTDMVQSFRQAQAAIDMESCLRGMIQTMKQ